ncbi:MobA/MobL family protein [Vagococcus fluvialis]
MFVKICCRSCLRKGTGIEVAIFHLSLSVKNRNNGKVSLIAMAAYRSGEKLYSELYNKYSLYNHRVIAPDAFILKPEHVPAEFANRQILWNKMELAEKFPNAQICRELNVALPVELDHQIQKRLVEEFVQDNFVSQGMIADCAIHRDEEHNPHAHIMLTMREVDSEGNIRNKRKRVPVLDENNEQVTNEKGQRVTISVKTNNWDRKTLVSEIRSDWANKVNQILREHKIDQQITEKSHKELGKRELPSVHEGYYTKVLAEKGITSELKKKNLAIQNFNEIIQELDKLEAQQQILKDDPNFRLKFEKTFSPLEKKELKNLSSELRLFIDDKNVNKRLEELKRWENSLVFNNKVELQKQRLLLNKISDEREKLQQAEQILNKQAQRFFKKAYPTLNLEKFSKQDIRTIVNETIAKKDLLGKEEMVKVLYERQVVDLANEKKIFKEKPFQTERYLQMKIDQVADSIKLTSNPEQKEVLQTKLEKLEQLKVGLKDYVHAEVAQRFDQNVEIDSVIEGELLLAKADYYQTTDFVGVEDQPRFSIEELNRMLEQSKGYLTNIETPKIANDCQGIYFIQDSLHYKEQLTPLAKMNLAKVVERNQYLPESDKQTITQQLQEKQERSQEQTQDIEQPRNTVLMFKLAKLTSKLLQGPHTRQKKRNLEKLVKQTRGRDPEREGYPKFPLG